MKKALSTILIFVVFVPCYAQVKKVFLSVGGLVTDSISASSYLLINKMSDTAWTTKQYDIKNRLLAQGTYKDADLATPHGTFLYYAERPAPRVLPPDSAMYVRAKGEYVNGLRHGVWTDYFENSGKELVNTFKNGELSGPFESYDPANKELKAVGINVNGVRDGNTIFFDAFGNLWQTITYKMGKPIKKEIIKYRHPIMPRGFADTLKAHINNLINIQTNIKLAVTAVVTPQGKLTEGRIITNKKLNNSILDEVYKVIAAGPQWEPAYNNTLKENVKFRISMAVQVTNGDIKVSYPLPDKYAISLTDSFAGINKDTLNYSLVATPPYFSGGTTKFLNLIRSKLNFNTSEMGTVITNFVIMKDGSIDDVKIAKGVSEMVDTKIIQAIKSLPKWEPAYLNGEPVNMGYTLPINFN